MPVKVNIQPFKGVFRWFVNRKLKVENLSANSMVFLRLEIVFLGGFGRWVWIRCSIFFPQKAPIYFDLIRFSV